MYNLYHGLIILMYCSRSTWQTAGSSVVWPDKYATDIRMYAQIRQIQEYGVSIETANNPTPQLSLLRTTPSGVFANDLQLF
jgi:hypothetical protein